ncbi:hypothetical protein NDU88_003200 [Pleurodeles waltl]|uniref:Uncharacterized protein n=1 Tax=Pleurodeles waltl TaxID=8319 RepID=A0AAV7T441_PLEWA|nr:hypothetical protein NDU88_003200 [Pleurodeles waltl]
MEVPLRNSCPRRNTSKQHLRVPGHAVRTCRDPGRCLQLHIYARRRSSIVQQDEGIRRLDISSAGSNLYLPRSTKALWQKLLDHFQGCGTLRSDCIDASRPAVGAYPVQECPDAGAWLQECARAPSLYHEGVKELPRGQRARHAEKTQQPRSSYAKRLQERGQNTPEDEGRREKSQATFQKKPLESGVDRKRSLCLRLMIRKERETGRAFIVSVTTSSHMLEPGRPVIGG